MIEITDERHKELIKAEAKLLALEAGGVDNWEGYDFAMEDFYKEFDSDNLEDEDD